MKQSSYKGKSPLPDFVIDAACAGNAEAVERVLQHYDGYINKLCTRTLYDGSGQPHICIDEYMKRRLQIKLIHSIVSGFGTRFVHKMKSGVFKLPSNSKVTLLGFSSRKLNSRPEI